MIDIQVLELFSTLFTFINQTIKEVIVPALPILGPLFILGLILGAIKLMYESIISTRIGALTMLCLVVAFLMNQGVF